MSLLSAPRRSAALARPLPVGLDLLQRNGIALRSSQFSLWAAAPGVGKTVMANNIAVKTPVPTLYFSADSDEWTVKSRICSIITGYTLEQVEQYLGSDDPSWEAYFQAELAKVDHIDWRYHSDLEPEFIVELLEAYDAVYADYPQLIIVDNLGNTYDESGDEMASLRSACRELQRIARKTGAHVMGLHHVMGNKENGDKPIYLADLIGKIGKIPEQVFGLNWSHEIHGNDLTLTVPKNRGGKPGMHLPFQIDYTRATVGSSR